MEQKGKSADHIPARPKTPPPKLPDVLCEVTAHWIDATQLFNILIFANRTTVIDVRSADDFKTSHLRSSIGIPVEDCAGKDMVELEDGYGLRFRQRRSNKVVVYDLASAPDAEGAAAGSDVAGFVDMLKKDRRCSQPVAMVKGGMAAIEKKYPFLIKGNSAFSELEYPSEILEDFLYLGNQAASSTRKILDDLSITCVINATATCDMPFKDLNCIQCALDDAPGADIRQYFDQSLSFLEEAKRDGKRVLIHCQMGMSRSSTLVILWLMHTRKWTLQKATEFTRDLRPYINPNPGFMQQLGFYETELLGSTTIRFPKDGKPITLRTVYESLMPDGQWVPRKVVGYKDAAP